MLIRIVQLSIKPDCIKQFKSIFTEAAPHIRAFPGCLRLDLWQQVDLLGEFATFSHWQDTESLDAYRASELFRSRWATIRPMFSSEPRVFSYNPA